MQFSDQPPLSHSSDNTAQDPSLKTKEISHAVRIPDPAYLTSPDRYLNTAMTAETLENWRNLPQVTPYNPPDYLETMRDLGELIRSTQIYSLDETNEELAVKSFVQINEN